MPNLVPYLKARAVRSIVKGESAQVETTPAPTNEQSMRVDNPLGNDASGLFAETNFRLLDPVVIETHLETISVLMCKPHRNIARDRSVWDDAFVCLVVLFVVRADRRMTPILGPSHGEGEAEPKG